MRLRSRSHRSPGSEHPFDAWTTVGNLDSRIRAGVDPSGRVAVAGAGWSLDWWIGAEDRWHRPSQETAVRQQLVGASPVVETRVRIPSGDAVSRAYGARGPRGEDLVVVEVHNDSKVPVALALAVQAHEGGGRIGALSLAGSVLSVDGSPALHLARSPGRIALSTASDDRPAGEVVLAGDAEPVHASAVTCDAGRAQGVLLFPLAHTATLRVAIAVDGDDRAVDPVELPSAQQVASGWATHSRGAARIEVPDRRLRDAIAASTRFLLLGGDRGLALAERADRWRHHGIGLHDGEAEGLAVLIEEWAREPEPNGLAALPAIAELLDAAGERRAATDVRALAPSRPAEPQADPPDLQDLLASASPTWTWSGAGTGHDLTANARFLLAVRAHLVRELDDGLALSPVVPDAWLGQGWEVHDLPTGVGQLSYAVRWHAERPALLWELEPHPGVGPARLTVPVLDPAWSTTEAAGEVLLAPVPVPERPSQRRGLTIPVTIEPVRRPR